MGDSSAKPGAMPTARVSTVPEGYVAVPITFGSGDEAPASLLQLCVLVKAKPDPVAGHFVQLASPRDARVLLGCLIDAGANVWDWVQIWIQTASGLAESVQAAREVLSNRLLDERWERTADAFASLGENGGLLLGGWEKENPPPLVINPTSARVTALADPTTKSTWALCRDDAYLTAAGLPPYSASLHRYLCLSDAPAEGPLVLVTAGAPSNPRTRSLAEALRPGGAEHLPLNIEGGRMMVRRLSPIPLEAFLEVLGGRAWPGIEHGTAVVPLSGAAMALRDSARTESGSASMADGHLFLGRHGRWGRVVEAFHLKLRVLADMVASTRQFVQVLNRPLLSLRPQSFEVRLPPPGIGLPFLWGAAISLCDPGDAIPLPIPGTEARYFARPREGLSIYQPESEARAVDGTCALRIRQVTPDAAQGMVLDGTLTTPERLSVQANDLVWLRPVLASGAVDLYARLDPPEANRVQGEWRFRTIAQQIGGRALSELQSAAGVPLPRVAFGVIPLLSTPCDLYALAVLAVQTLLVDPQKFPLPVALDEVMSLARQVAQDHDASVGTGLRVRAVFDSDPRWLAALGPQRLVADELTPQQCFDLVPPELWWDTLACVVRMFPGFGPDSTCANFGDAPPLGLQKVFNRAVDDLQSLIERTRSLIVIDWQFNREVRAVLRSKLAEIAPDAATKTAPVVAPAQAAQPTQTAPARKTPFARL